MGTQFSSRLTKKEREQVMARALVIAREMVKASGARVIDNVPRKVRREIIDAVIGEMLTAANRHHFFEEFEASGVFVSVLEWLKSLQRDADNQGFRTTIEQYELADHGMPHSVLIDKLREITGRPEYQSDPFRVAVSHAASVVMADAAVLQVRSEAADSEAVVLGRQLGQLGMKKLVDRFVSQFVTEFLLGLLGKADPARLTEEYRELRDLAQEDAADRIAVRVVRRIEKEGVLCQAHEIRRVVQEILADFVSSRKKKSGAA